MPSGQSRKRRLSKTELVEAPVSDLASRPTSDPRRFDLGKALPLIITLAAGAACYGLFFNRDVSPSVVGYSVAPAERVLHGEVPYRDFVYNYTPGILWLNALLMKVLHPGLLVIAAGLLVFKLCTLVSLFLISSRFVCKWAALIPITLTLAWLGYRDGFAVVPTQYSLLFVLLGAACFLRHNQRARATWLLAGGLAVGVVFTFKYNVGILVFAAGLAAILIKETMETDGLPPGTPALLQALKNSLVYLLGFLLVVGPVVFYLARQHALAAMIDHFLHHAPEYAGRRSAALPSVRRVLPVALGSLSTIVAGLVIYRKAPRLLAPYIFVVSGLAAAALFIPRRIFIVKESASAAIEYLAPLLFATVIMTGVWQLRRSFWIAEPRRKWWQANGNIAILTLFSIAAYLELYPRADYFHLIRVLPPTFLLLTVFTIRWMQAIRRRFDSRLGQSTLTALLSAAAGLSLLVLVGVKDTWQPHFDRFLQLKERTPLSMERAQGILVSHKEAAWMEEIDRLINANSAGTDSIFSFAQPGTAFYFLSDRKNPTRVVWWRAVGLSKEERESALRLVEERQPKLVLVRDSLKDRRIWEMVDANYDRVGEAGSIGVYDRRP